MLDFLDDCEEPYCHLQSYVKFSSSFILERTSRNSNHSCITTADWPIQLIDQLNLSLRRENDVLERSNRLAHPRRLRAAVSQNVTA